MNSGEAVVVVLEGCSHVGASCVDSICSVPGWGPHLMWTPATSFPPGQAAVTLEEVMVMVLEMELPAVGVGGGTVPVIGLSGRGWSRLAGAEALRLGLGLPLFPSSLCFPFSRYQDGFPRGRDSRSK